MIDWRLVVLVGGVLSGCTVELQPLPEFDAVEQGARIFNGYAKPGVNCWKCHDGSGRGSAKAPSLYTRVPRRSHEQLVTSITDGLGKMPSFKEDLTPQEIDALAAWLKTQFRRPVE